MSNTLLLDQRFIDDIFCSEVIFVYIGYANLGQLPIVYFRVTY